MGERSFFIYGLMTPFESKDDELFETVLKEEVFKGKELELLEFEFDSQMFKGDELSDVICMIFEDSPTWADIIKGFNDADTVLLVIYRWYSGIGGITDFFDFDDLLNNGLNPQLFNESERQLLKGSFISVKFERYWEYDENALIYRFKFDRNTKEWLRSFHELFDTYPFQDICLYKGDEMIMSSISHECMCFGKKKVCYPEDFYHLYDD